MYIIEEIGSKFIQDSELTSILPYLSCPIRSHTCVKQVPKLGSKTVTFNVSTWYKRNR